MKKILLGLTALFALSASAQQTVSFESSENYSIGSAEAQGIITGYWDLTDYPTEYETMFISDTRATNGTQSLEFESDFSGWIWMDGVVLPISTSGNFEVSFDIYLESDEDSDVSIQALQLEDGDEEYTTAGEIRFNWQGFVRTRNGSNGLVGSTPYLPGQWYPVKIVVNTTVTPSTITYYFDGVEVSTGELAATAISTLPIDKIGFLYDNYGSGFNVDNVVVTNITAGTNDFVKNNFKVFPNPATDVLNLTAMTTASINNVSITDVNGRTVKQQNLNGVSAAQINVSDLTAGVYFVSVDSAQGKGTMKFVKK